MAEIESLHEEGGTAALSLQLSNELIEKIIAPRVGQSPEQVKARLLARISLVALYYATDGANWENNANWLSDEPFGDWHGVETDAAGQVTRINLKSNGLDGTIPPELGQLSNLQYLNLRYNQLSGEIPSELGQLSLNHFYLRGNQFTGCYSSDLGTLAANHDLDEFGLSLCGQEEAVLTALYNATGGDGWTNNANWLSDEPLGDWHGVKTDAAGHVTWINLPSNGLDGTIPPELGQQLGQLYYLRELNLGANQLSGKIPSELGGLSNLEYLGLAYNQLSGEIPSELGDLSNLQYLGLGNNQLSGKIPSELGQPSNLRELYLGGNQLSGEIPLELGHLIDLQALSLRGNQLSGEIPSKLGYLFDLQKLNLSDNQLSGEIPSELGQLGDLRKLRLGGNQFTGCHPFALTAIPDNDISALGLPKCDSQNR